MKKIALALVMALGLSACGVASPDPGQEAVLVAKPMFFGHGGVIQTPVKTGKTYTAFTTDAIYVDMFPKEYKVSFDDLMTKDGVPMHFDATLVLTITDSVKLVEKFGPKWFENNISSVYGSLIRQEVRKHPMAEVAIDTTAIDNIDRVINTELKKYITEKGLPLNVGRSTVGKANPPPSVKDQRVKTAQEQQRAETETAGQKAEVTRKQREIARADADNAYRTQMNLSPEQFVELERIKAIKESCADGGKCTLIVGGQAIYTAK